MSNIYFTSDTHYHHRNIVRGTTSWTSFEEGSSHQGVRDFSTLEEHDDTIVKNINQLVKENDILYHLGDWSFGGHEQIKLFRDRLNCKNIHLILGNHDQWIEKSDSPYRNLFSSVQHYKELSLKVGTNRSGKFGKTKFILSHYAMRVWNKSHRGSIMLHGHSHGTLPNYSNPTGEVIYKTMDVGVDTNNLYSYHLDQILDIMKSRETLLEVDHHSTNTN